MNDNFTKNEREDDIARKLIQVAEQTHADAQFAAELDEKLRKARQPKSNWLAGSFKPISPALRWAFLMILLAVALSWSIKTLILAPQPASENTPAVTDVTTPTPTPALQMEETATLVTQEGGFDFRDSKLYLKGPLPEGPNQAHVYLLKKDEPATEEQARALAERFGIQGEMYTTPGYVFGNDNYLISDGKQSLEVYSQRLFTYVADLSKTSRISTNTPSDNAEAVIREFLQTRGFDFQFSILPTNIENGYIVRPLAPDSIPMQYESFTLPALRMTLDETGQVLSMDSSLMDYDAAPVGEYEIISAQEAFEHLLDDYALVGKMEYVNSPSPMRDWFRKYPDNQPVTTYGYITIYPAADSGKPPLVLIDGVPVIGNTNGLESLERFTLVKATGQYIVENGIRKLNVESWDRGVQESTFPGSLSRQGDQIILTTNDGQQYPLIDPPADAPLELAPGSTLEVHGVIEDGKLSWMFMRLFENSGGGGGGGGNVPGFFKLNLTGTPVPFPSPLAPPQTDSGSINYVVQENDTLASIALNYGISIEALMQANNITENIVITGQTLVIPNSDQATNDQFIRTYTVKEGDTLTSIAQNFGTTVEELKRINSLTEESIYIDQPLYVPIPEPVEQSVQDLRGWLSITINMRSNGTSTKEYRLDVPEGNGFTVYTMEGPVLNELDSYNVLPILVSGTINTQGVLVVDSYKIPYPNLQFQILKGTQKMEQIDGQGVIIFTTEDGKPYVEFWATNSIPNTTFMVGYQGDLIEQEVLVIPDETFGGYPVARIFQSAIFEGTPEMGIQGNRIKTIYQQDDPLMSPGYTPPKLTIDHVELVYYVSNPYYQVNDPNYSQRSPYIEPAWHFVGHYEDGTQFDVLIQAIKQEFLLPERVPSPGMG